MNKDLISTYEVFVAKSKTGILRALLDRAPKLQIDCTPLLQASLITDPM